MADTSTSAVDAGPSRSRHASTSRATRAGEKTPYWYSAASAPPFHDRGDTSGSAPSELARDLARDADLLRLHVVLERDPRHQGDDDPVDQDGGGSDGDRRERLRAERVRSVRTGRGHFQSEYHRHAADLRPSTGTISASWEVMEATMNGTSIGSGVSCSIPPHGRAFRGRSRSELKTHPLAAGLAIAGLVVPRRDDLRLPDCARHLRGGDAGLIATRLLDGPLGDDLLANTSRQRVPRSSGRLAKCILRRGKCFDTQENPQTTSRF